MRPCEHVLNMYCIVVDMIHAIFPFFTCKYNHDVKYCRQQWKSSGNAVPDVVWSSASLPSHLLDVYADETHASSTYRH